MIKKVIALFSLAIMLRCFVQTEAFQGIDVSQPISTNTFSCLKQKGYNFVIVRAFRSIGVPDYNAPQTVRNAREANFTKVEAYMFPCPKCGNAKQQVENMLSLHLGVDRIWLDIEISNWYENKTKNQEFFEDLVSAPFGTGIGVYTNRNNWSTIMGLEYTEGFAYPLWYAHYDGQPNFSDFVPFSGWKEPWQKQFSGDQLVCEVDMDLNYRPAELVTF